MAFKKTGDATPITDLYDSNVKERFCPECGRKLTVIAIEDEEVKLVCQHCDVENKTNDLPED